AVLASQWWLRSFNGSQTCAAAMEEKGNKASKSTPSVPQYRWF
ncbi:hypothetical protein A2U01_0059199, partial [Trifolium medium]|nr:hypothetical protein [Trifolium medium]